HPDGAAWFRGPSAENPAGQSAAGNPVFEEAKRSPTDGIVEEPLVSGGPIYLSAFHLIGSPPLVVTVSLDRDEVLTGWRRQVWGSAAFFLVFGILMGATLTTLFRQMDAKARAERELALARQQESERLRDAEAG